MDPQAIALIALRGVGTLFALQGQPEARDTINALLAAHQAGKNVDAHMAAIADNLEVGGELESWTEITNRINDVTDDFLGDPADDGNNSSEPPA